VLEVYRARGMSSPSGEIYFCCQYAIITPFDDLHEAKTALSVSTQNVVLWADQTPAHHFIRTPTTNLYFETVSPYACFRIVSLSDQFCLSILSVVQCARGRRSGRLRLTLLPVTTRATNILVR
jgi:hypothetical protein